MRDRRWSWIGACSTGSSHHKSGTECQDYAACLELVSGDNPALLAVVSDGAGSAEFAAVGSHIVVQGFTRCAIEHVRAGEPLKSISEETVRDWLDVIRDRIARAADQRGAKPRDLAATLVSAIVCVDRAIVCHIGDGACALRQVGNSNWEVPSWPLHGEYASSTYFVTDDPQPNLQFCTADGEFSDIAVFSDGLERLALDFQNKTAFGRFFDPMFAPLANLEAGRNRALSKSLRNFLDSQQVVKRTDDDKSLVMARRVSL
jgi:Protein phosphatase 2C